MIIEIHPYDGSQNNVGLANKLRTIISFAYHCDTNNYKLKIVWDYFYNMFPHILDDKLFTNDNSDIKYGPPLFYPIGECNSCYGGSNVEASIDYYSKCFPFQKYFNKLIPKSSIYDLIVSNENHINNFFGVHLRLGDWISFAKENNLFLPSLDDYIKKIDILLEENNGFYFTSDDIHSYSVMKNRYGSKVFYIENKNLNRMDSSNFDFAYIDMVLLSKTKFILGNTHSTFSYHSARINNIPLYSYDGKEWLQVVG